MQLTLPERGKPKGRLVLERGQLTGQSFRVEPKVCGDPVCECNHLTLHCFPETPAEKAVPDAPRTLELDLGPRVLVKPTTSEATPESILAKAFMDEITPEQWHYLWSFFYALKILYTEQANLDDLDTSFPSNAGDGGMVGYYEILPFARPINFTAEGDTWAFDDQYCLRPDCSCRAAVLQCFRITPQGANAAPQGPNLSLRYHYDTQRFEDLERSGSNLSPKAFLDSIRQVQNDFDGFLAKRHAQLRRLYLLYSKRHAFSEREVEDQTPSSEAVHDSPPQPFRAAHKPGRNDPCPCGSGKKYKKCCANG